MLPELYMLPTKTQSVPENATKFKLPPSTLQQTLRSDAKLVMWLVGIAVRSGKGVESELVVLHLARY